MANLLVLYALVDYNARETKKRIINLLVINQNLIDLTACVILVITYVLKLCNIYLTGMLGYFLCVLFIGESSTNSSLYASIIDLMSTPLEFSYAICVLL